MSVEAGEAGHPAMSQISRKFANFGLWFTRYIESQSVGRRRNKMNWYVARRLLPVLFLLVVAPAIGHTQFADETQTLFEISPSTVDRNTNQVVIEFKDEEVIEETEVEEVTDPAICCQLPEDERLASDICVNVSCPEAP
jgi:hypothetical protein